MLHGISMDAWYLIEFVLIIKINKKIILALIINTKKIYKAPNEPG